METLKKLPPVAVRWRFAVGLTVYYIKGSPSDTQDDSEIIALSIFSWPGGFHGPAGLRALRRWETKKMSHKGPYLNNMSLHYAKGNKKPTHYSNFVFKSLNSDSQLK